MTTAARPTFEPARGGRGKGEGDLSQLSKQYSSRDLPSHTKIKYRQTTQDAPEEVRNRDFRRELEERERAAAREKNRDRPTREHTTSSSVSKKPRLDQIPAANLDADDPLTDEEDEDEDFEEESDDDDTAALLAELEKIKKERAEEQARKTFSHCPLSGRRIKDEYDTIMVYKEPMDRMKPSLSICLLLPAFFPGIR
uniref:spliceosome-associated protein CWC15 homolog isoform X2 n=1 Tax=Nyctereutes procyonoides TaxID=34880 RepID=UPI0024443B48|nr:spliceosome-associated protein CWC15 homolog isoform X2 [Nyctereutes procyonoides]